MEERILTNKNGSNLSLRVFRMLLAVLPLLVIMTACLSVTSEEFERQCRGKLVAIAVMQDEYKSSKGQYATFEELRDAGKIESDKTIDNLTPAYHLGWFLSEGRSKFTIAATPTDDPVLKSYIIDGAKAIMIMAPEDVTDPGRMWKTFMDAESMVYSENNQYNWPDIPEYRNSDTALELLLDETGSAFFLANPGDIGLKKPVGDLGPEYVYLSTTQKYYKMSPSR